MPKWQKPTNLPATITKTDNTMQSEGAQEMEQGRTRPAGLYPNFGTWGDRVFPGSHHTSDPKAPKVS